MSLFLEMELIIVKISLLMNLNNCDHGVIGVCCTLIYVNIVYQKCEEDIVSQFQVEPYYWLGSYQVLLIRPTPYFFSLYILLSGLFD